MKASDSYASLQLTTHKVGFQRWMQR